MNCPYCDCTELRPHGSSNGKVRYICDNCNRTTTNPIIETDSDESVRLARALQHVRDRNRLERRTFRNRAREVTAIEELNRELIKTITENGFGKYKITSHPNNLERIGIFQISDTHFNELISSINNEYNFEVANKRLYKFVVEAIDYFRSKKITDVIVVMTGDLLNSDRRPDEILSATTNRANAIFIAVDILKSVLLHLNSKFNLKVVNVCGNESRFDKDWNWGEITASNNFDLVIYKILKLILNSKSIQFLDGNAVEQVITVQGKNILLTHGNSLVFKSGKAHEAIEKIKGKYAGKGIILDYVLFGHIHACYIGGTFARSGSLAGGNAYSDKELQYDSNASQNIFIVSSKGIDGIQIDLQDYKDYAGYTITPLAKKYLIKAEVDNEETIIKV